MCWRASSEVSTIVCALELLLLPIVLVTPFFVKFVAFARTVSFLLGALIGLLSVLLLVATARSPAVGHWQRHPVVATLSFAVAVVVLAMCSIPLGLVERQWDLNYFWNLNYFVGPARAVLAGGVPYVDVQSQYGASYLIYLLGVPFGILPTFSSALLITGIVNIVTFTLYIAIMIRRTGQPVVSALAGVTIALFVTTWIPYFSFAPMTGGVRFLPVTVLLFAIILAESRERLISPWLVAAFAWSLLWSAESSSLLCLARASRGPGARGAACFRLANNPAGIRPSRRDQHRHARRRLCRA